MAISLSHWAEYFLFIICVSWEKASHKDLSYILLFSSAGSGAIHALHYGSILQKGLEASFKIQFSLLVWPFISLCWDEYICFWFKKPCRYSTGKKASFFRIGSVDLIIVYLLIYRGNIILYVHFQCDCDLKLCHMLF